MTRRSDERAWSEFAAWCRTRRLKALPAHPWTVAAYARWCEARHGFPMIVQRIRAVARAHVLECVASPDRHPTVTRTLRLLERRHEQRNSRAALFPAHEATADAISAAVADPAPSASAGRGRRLATTPKLVRRRPTGH